MAFAPYNNNSCSTFLFSPYTYPSSHSRSQTFCYIYSLNTQQANQRINKMGKDPKGKTPSHSRVGSLSNLPYSAVAAAAEVDRKVYIPLCFCLVSFAVMVYIN